jgi:hypothetical protein
MVRRDWRISPKEPSLDPPDDDEIDEGQDESEDYFAGTADEAQEIEED